MTFTERRWKPKIQWLSSIIWLAIERLDSLCHPSIVSSSDWFGASESISYEQADFRLPGPLEEYAVKTQHMHLDFSILFSVLPLCFPFESCWKNYWISVIVGASTYPLLFPPRLLSWSSLSNSYLHLPLLWIFIINIMVVTSSSGFN